MNKKRWLLATTILASVLGLVVLVLAQLTPQPGVTQANFRRLAVGMTEAEVNEILGEPRIPQIKQTGLAMGHKRVAWAGEFSLVISVFDERDRLVEKTCLEDPPPFVFRLRKRFPWLRI
jgi:hypothetical protein